MIIEGILTTLGDDGAANVAAMGVLLDPEHRAADGRWLGFRLRPFPGSRTYRNLQRRPAGVFHLTDDVLLLARAALGDVADIPLKQVAPAGCPALADCVRAFAFVVESADWSSSRANLNCRIEHVESRRDWIGWNRAQHAVLELTISATRVSMIERAVIEAQIETLTPLIEKTAGPNEFAAWRFVNDYLRRAWSDAESAAP